MTSAKTKRNVFSFGAIALVAIALAALAASMFLPNTALANDPVFVSGSQKKAVRIADSLTAKEKKAYKRVVAACYDYENQGTKIEVDVSDLGLTQNQALHVGYLLHSDGELFWINTFGDSSSDKEKFNSTKFSIPVSYDDATITAMRAELDAAVNKALKRITPDMDPVTKIHTLHDYVIDLADYVDGNKTAYNGLVEGKSDCFGFARTMDLLLRRAGFTTDMAYRNDGLHAWNLVKVYGKWFHVDVAWDNGYTGKYFWTKTRCHWFLLQSDKAMAKTEHKGWWAHHKCKSDKYREDPTETSAFIKHCNDYKLYTKGFTADGLKYKVCGSAEVKVADVKAAKVSAKSIVIPATVRHKNITYKVVGIEASAFSGTKAKVLKVISGNFTYSNLTDSLLGSNVKKVKLVGAAKKKKATYVKAFSESNCGKSVVVA